MGRFRRAARPREVNVKLKLPFVGEFGGTWAPQRAEAEAAWELYVELATRITYVELRPGEGLIREALTSVYSLFGTTRDILRRYGPAVSPADRAGELTFGNLALTVLNLSLRPLLAQWHPRLLAWEDKRPDDVSKMDHENAWDQVGELRARLEEARLGLVQLANVLAKVAGAAPLVTDPRLLSNPEKERGGG